MKVELLVSISTPDYTDAKVVQAALASRLEGWDVDATVALLSEEESINQRLAGLNKKIHAVGRQLFSLEAAREALREEIRRKECKDQP